MIKVKLSMASDWPLKRQTPDSKGIWGNYQFFLNEKIEKCDYWVVFGGVKESENTICPKKNTIFVATEPKNIKRYNTNFLKQFETIITSASNVKHTNIIQNQHADPWMIGAEYSLTTNTWGNFLKNYDNLKHSEKSVKNKLISVISSNKNSTKEHRQRLKFVNELKKHFGDKIDIFGKGLNDFSDKWDTISPYKYHIAIENCSHKDHFSEKLSDTFLAETYPIYYGCPNIYDYFSKNSLTTIDIKKPKEAIKIIENTIKNNQYKKSIQDILNAKNLVLDKYNFFPTIIEVIEIIKDSKHLKYEIIETKPESYYPLPTTKRIFLVIFNFIKPCLIKINSKIKKLKNV